MDESTFEARLKADGYTEIEAKTLAPRPANVAHEHPYSIRGFVVSGTFIVTQDQHQVSFQPGQAFDVLKGKPHTEEIGPDGARILVGRKY